jgi:hypothetical protein
VCPHCSFPVSASATVCPQCHLGISEQTRGTVAGLRIPAPATERLHRWILVCAYGGIVTWLLVAGSFQYEYTAVAAVAVACSVWTLIVTKHGRLWTNLSPMGRATAIPGILAGLLIFLTVGLVIGLLYTSLKGYGRDWG